MVAAHYTYTGPRDVHKPALRVDPAHPELLASRMATPRLLRVAGALLLAAGCLAAFTAEAGWLIVDENGDRTLVSRGRLKMDPRQAQGQSMVLDLTRAHMWVADAGRHLYWEGTVEEYCQAVRTLAPSLPPPPAAGSGGAGAPPPAVTLERTDETETIANLPTRKYRVLVDSKLYEELWLTGEAALVRELDLARAPDTFGRMFACMVSMGGQPPEASAEYRRVFAEGWPLKAVYHGEGGSPGRALVTRVEEREIDERDFAPPAGFRAVPLGELFGKR